MTTPPKCHTRRHHQSRPSRVLLVTNTQGEISDESKDSWEDSDSDSDNDDQDNTGTSSTTFPLMKFPLEIRELIWQHALPDGRVFHVKGVETVHGTKSCFVFHTIHPPPSVLEACTESRRTALLRAGCFRFAQAHPASTRCKEPRRFCRCPRHGPWSPFKFRPRLWFNPNKDVLYFDRGMRGALVPETPREKSMQPALDRIAGFDRVVHVGLEWRFLLPDGDGEEPPLEAYSGEALRRRHWAPMVGALIQCMPRLSTIHFLLPLVRHPGGYIEGKELTQLETRPIDLVPLPGRTMIPIESGHRTWDDVCAELSKVLAAEEIYPLKGQRPLEVVGWRLLRRGALQQFGWAKLRVFD